MKIPLTLKHLVVLGIVLFNLTSIKSQYYRPLWVIKTEMDSIAIKAPDWTYTISVGLNASYTNNTNVPGGTSQNGFSGTNTIDAYVNKTAGKFLSTNEFHYQVSFFRAGAKSASVIKSYDNMLTLHDWSVRNGPESKWNLNFIAKISTPLIKSYKDGFLSSSNANVITPFERPGNPYDVSFAPGFKCIVNKKLNISLSPYALRFYGVTDQALANLEIYDTGGIDTQTGFYKKSKTETKGAELNIWFDWNYKEILIFEYRADFSSKYSSSLFKEGLFNGLFTTKFRVIKDLYITHRAILNGIIEQRPLKPELRQTVLLAYSFAFN